MVTALIILAIWSGSGVLLAWLFRRRGRNFLAYAGLGIGYGPLIALFLIDIRRNQERIVTVLEEGQPLNESGWLDVLVGLDGTSGSIESARSVIAMLGPSIHRIRLASVLDLETANTKEAFETDDALVEQLRAAAEHMEVPEAELVLLSGRPDAALVDHAIEEKMDLLVVAHRQHRTEALMLGSTVARLARDAELPVLIGPPSEES